MPQLNKVSKNNTKIYPLLNGGFEVRLHSTCIITVDKVAKTITLNTGGWNTATTRNRLNQVSNEYNLGYKVYQKIGILWVYYKEHRIPFGANRVTFDIEA